MEEERRKKKVSSMKYLVFNKKTLSGILLTAIFLFIFLYFQSTASAQTQSNYDVTVSPVFFDLNTNPGDNLSEKVRIRNNTTSPIAIKLQVQGISGDLNGNLTLKEDKLNQAVEWIKFQDTKVVLKPLEWTEVPFTVNIPKEAAYGYYVAISFTQDKEAQPAKTGATITGAAAVPILLNVRKAGAKSDAKILDFSITNYISEYLPTDFIIKVQNTGNVHVKPHGSIFISGPASKNIASLDVNPGLGSILPNSARIFQSSWSDGFIVNQPIVENGQPKLDKNGKQMTRLAFNWNKLTSFRFGKYTASLLLVFDNGARDVPLETTISFWIIPYKVIIGLVISFILLIIIIRYLLNYYINRQIQKRTDRGL